LPVACSRRTGSLSRAECRTQSRKSTSRAIWELNCHQRVRTCASACRHLASPPPASHRGSACWSLGRSKSRAVSYRIRPSVRLAAPSVAAVAIHPPPGAHSHSPTHQPTNPPTRLRLSSLLNSSIGPLLPHTTPPPPSCSLTADFPPHLSTRHSSSCTGSSPSPRLPKRNGGLPASRPGSTTSPRTWCCPPPKKTPIPPFPSQLPPTPAGARPLSPEPTRFSPLVSRPACRARVPPLSPTPRPQLRAPPVLPRPTCRPTSTGAPTLPTPALPRSCRITGDHETTHRSTSPSDEH
jgi:hypothetical protein